MAFVANVNAHAFCTLSPPWRQLTAIELRPYLPIPLRSDRKTRISLGSRSLSLAISIQFTSTWAKYIVLSQLRGDQSINSDGALCVYRVAQGWSFPFQSDISQ